MSLRRSQPVCLLAMALISCAVACIAQSPTAQPAQKIILDTDIGDDIDDVFAVGLLLSSPEVKVLGIMSAWGDTALRSRMIDRLLCETGREDIPSVTGLEKTRKGAGTFSQRPWAAAGLGRQRQHQSAVPFLLDQIRNNPGEITLVALGPLTNIGAAIDQDPETFRKLKRVVLMGGSIYKGYSDSPGIPGTRAIPPQPEYNIAMDPEAAQKLFRSGVPIYMMPLDSTQIKFDETKRALLATISTPLTDATQILTAEWSHVTRNQTPTLFDPVAAAYAIDNTTCPTIPLHIEIDNDANTRVTPGAPNANACLEPHPDAFFALLLPRLLDQHMAGIRSCVAPSPR